MEVQLKHEDDLGSLGENGPTKAAAKRKPAKAKRVFLGMLSLVVIIGAVYYVHGIGRESTDDAYLAGHIVNVSSRVAGQVAKVLVEDNQLVEAGTPLVEFDRSVLEARLAAASADLDAAQASARAAEAQLSMTETSTETNLSAARSRMNLAEAELRRIRKLRQGGVVSTAELDAKQSAYDTAKAAYEQAEAHLRSDSGSKGKGKGKSPTKTSAQVAAARAAFELAGARVAQAEAAQKLAALNLSYAVVTAPLRGRVSRRSVEIGQVVAPGTPLLAIVPLDDVWIVANFKEDQIAAMKAGQKAEVSIDSYSESFPAHVESLSAATGATFALLPPDNASGNFVKVVQRIPVLIRFDDQAKAGVALRPGLSANVIVRTGPGLF